MARKSNSRERSPKDCRTCEQWKAMKERIRVTELLGKAIEVYEKRIRERNFSPSVAEYLKLVQLEQEAEQQDTKEIKVTWIDPAVTSEREE